jgi:hypothetical protein
MVIPCEKGPQCNWPACQLDCAGRHPMPLPTQDEIAAATIYDDDDDDDCDCVDAVEDILTGRVDCYVCGNFWYR